MLDAKLNEECAEYQAIDVSKTVTAATDTKGVGGRTLFLVNALRLTSQAKTFNDIRTEA